MEASNVSRKQITDEIIGTDEDVFQMLGSRYLRLIAEDEGKTLHRFRQETDGREGHAWKRKHKRARDKTE